MLTIQSPGILSNVSNIPFTKNVWKEHPSFAKMWMIGGQIHMEKRVAPMAGWAGNLADEQRPKPQSEILELCEKMGPQPISTGSLLANHIANMFLVFSRSFPLGYLR